MSITFRPAVRDETSLLIAMAGASGSGKTFSALRLATGLAGDGKIAMIDTEAGRGLHYAEKFRFDHAELKPPFTPEAYLEAIVKAQEDGYRAIVVDSFSHEYEGEGGLQDIQQADLERMAGGDARKMERLTAPSWKNAKLRHKKMVSRLLQVRSHLIFCLRAEEKIRFEKVKDDRGYEKTAIVPAGWVPICEKRWMYEMTLSVTMTPEAPGMPMFDGQGRPIHGKIQDQHRHAFPPGETVTEDSGRLLAEWARGNKPIASQPQSSTPAPADDSDDGDEIPVEPVVEMAREKATDGAAMFNAWHDTLTLNDKTKLEPFKPELRQRMVAAKERMEARQSEDQYG